MLRVELGRNRGKLIIAESLADFTRLPSGVQIRDVSPGKAAEGGVAAKPGDRVVFQWSGYTIGYFGRPFQASGGPNGGAFDKENDYDRTVIGSGTMVKGLEEGLVGLKQGQVRQIIVPYGALSYPPSDPKHEVVGPRPTTFSGMRALNFVLENNQMIDQTLLCKYCTHPTQQQGSWKIYFRVAATHPAHQNHSPPNEKTQSM